MQSIYLCSADQLPAPGELRAFTLEGRELCLANEGGQIAAIDNICPHRQGPLAEGTLEQGKVLCPWHAWAFDLNSGEVEHDPSVAVEVFPVEVRGPEVWLAWKP